jgi:MFS family permease
VPSSSIQVVAAARTAGREEDAAPPKTTFGDVFGVAEFRALWLAQLVSVTGDQLARVALTILVYDRTRSSALAAVTFAASVLPTFIGGLALSGLADRLPRRRVMIAANLTSGALIALMVLPGVSLVGAIMLLFAVTMIGAAFTSARAAIYPDILDGDRYVLGTAVTQTTNGFAQVLGFAVGGVAVGFLGVRTSLVADAATFGASALLIRARVHARPASRPLATSPLPAPEPPAARAAPRRGRHRRPGPLAEAASGVRLVVTSPAMRTPLLFGLLSAFYNVPDGLATPLARAVGGGAVTVGAIFASQALGQTVGAIGFSRLVTPAQRVRWTAPLAVAASTALAAMATGPGLPGIVVILACSGLFSCYQLAANASFVQATPPARRSQAFGIANGSLSLGQSVTIIIAGVAAAHVSPADVVAATGSLGVLCTLAIALTKAARACWPIRPGPGEIPPDPAT